MAASPLQRHGTPSSPEAVVGVGLVVLHPHVVLLGGSRPLLRRPRVRPGQQVLGHFRGWRESSEAGWARAPPADAARPGRSHRPHSPAPESPARLPPTPARRRSVLLRSGLPAHLPAPPGAPPRPAPPTAGQPPAAKGHRGARQPPSPPARRRGRRWPVGTQGRGGAGPARGRGGPSHRLPSEEQTPRPGH